MSNLLNLLEKIHLRPGMYLGKPSVNDLFMFLVGYEFARSELDIEPTEQEQKFYDEFQPWLQKKLEVKTVASWAKLIMLSCSGEKAGFDYFFQLLDEFFQQDKHSYIDDVDKDKAISYQNKMLHAQAQNKAVSSEFESEIDNPTSATSL